MNKYVLKKLFVNKSLPMGGGVFIFLFSLIFNACQKEEIPIADTSLFAVEQNQQIILGKKLQNAYSVENMRKAYEDLKKKSGLKANIEINTTHFYVRFLPKDSTDVNILLQDTSLELFDCPLDYEIKQDGLYYHDPMIPKEQPTWQYTVVPVDYQFPDVQYEILENCFIPNEDNNLKNSANAELLAKIEFESMLMTGNLSDDEKNEEGLKRWRLPSKKNPAGYLQVYNTSNRRIEGISRVKIRVHRLVKISSTYTLTNGYYRIPQSFRYRVHYAIIFQNATGFKIWGNRAFVAPARYNMNWHSKEGYSINIYANSIAWLWATINNGTYHYREELCPQFNINKPPAGLRLWTVRKNNGNWSGSTPMARQISLKAATFKDFLLGLGVSIGTNGIYTILPDIFIFPDYKDTQDTYSTLFHELSHASHYTKAGKWYWLKYIQGIIDNGGYGDGTGKNDGYIGVGEMWGNYFGNYVCCTNYFGSPVNWEPWEDWYNPGILMRLDDDYNFQEDQIFNCLTSDIKNHEKLKTKLIDNYGNTTQVNEAFAHYGF